MTQSETPETPEIPERETTASDADGQSPPGSPTSHAAGTRIKHYEVLRPLGQGGSAGILLARDTHLDRLVALKIPRRAERGGARLLAEARTLARLTHENIVMVYDVDESPEHPYMTLEYIQGRPLRELIMPAGLRAAVVLEVMTPVLRALAHAHDLGVMHRDLTPSNIMISDAGPIKVVDFGLARPLSSRKGAGAPKGWADGAPAGTLLYMSPEQIRGEDLDERCDIWAVGVVLHELLTGRHPFAPLAPGWLRDMLDLDTVVPCAATGEAAAGLDEVLQKCLRKRPAERFRAAGEVAAELEKLQRQASGHDGTWNHQVRMFKRKLARSVYREHGSYAAAARAKKVSRRTLQRHADG